LSHPGLTTSDRECASERAQSRIVQVREDGKPLSNQAKNESQVKRENRESAFALDSNLHNLVT